jgi:hypothetical protein
MGSLVAPNRFVIVKSEMIQAWQRRAVLALLIGVMSEPANAGLALVVTPPRSPPPALRVESRGPVPFRDAVWVDGRWGWRGGQYLWVSGHWQRAPEGMHHWKQGQWTKRDEGWFFTPGQWF